ncbi:SLOG family protein [Streptomyces niveus]
MSDRPYRILVTGSRDWDDHDLIRSSLAVAIYQNAPAVIVHGACPSGADATASWWVRRYRHLGITEERHPAQWRTHGRAAGPIRNQQMVHLGADICLAFIRNGSRGATGCADLAEAAGIPTKRWTT